MGWVYWMCYFVVLVSHHNTWIFLLTSSNNSDKLINSSSNYICIWEQQLLQRNQSLRKDTLKLTGRCPLQRVNRNWNISASSLISFDNEWRDFANVMVIKADKSAHVSLLSLIFCEIEAAQQQHIIFGFMIRAIVFLKYTLILLNMYVHTFM